MTSEKTHKLVQQNTGKILQVGDKVIGFRDEEYTIEGYTSPEDWSGRGTGRVHTDKGTFFPSVVDAVIVLNENVSNAILMGIIFPNKAD